MQKSIVKRLALVGLAGAAAASQASTFQITLTNLGPQPLSPMFFASSNSSFDEFAVGGTASVGIKHIAEMGDATDMMNIAAGAGSDVMDYTLGPGVITTGQSYTIMLDADAAHPFLSFASMLGKTNDGFIGASVSADPLQLFIAGNPLAFSYVLTGTQAWDAGTEENTQNAADLAFKGGSGNPADHDNLIRMHAGVIPNVGDSWQDMPSWGPTQQLARIDVAPVPEPASLAVIGMGLIALARRRRSKQA